MKLAAVILAVTLILWGTSWSQGANSEIPAQAVSQSAQPKKGQKQVKSVKKRSQPSKKGKKTVTRVSPPDKPIRGGPVGQGVK